MPSLNKAMTAALASFFAATSITLPAQALTKSEVLSLSYEQVKGSGLANRCPEVIGTEAINLALGKKYKVVDLCLEPTSWQVIIIYLVENLPNWIIGSFKPSYA